MTDRVAAEISVSVASSSNAFSKNNSSSCEAPLSLTFSSFCIFKPHF